MFGPGYPGCLMSQCNTTLLWTAAAIIAPIVAFLVMTKCRCCAASSDSKEKEENNPILQIDPQEFKKFKLVKKEQVTHNSCLYRFQLDDESRSLGLLPGQHVQIRAVMADGQEVIKPYTPVSLASTAGHFDLLIKTYPQGRVSKYMDGVTVGDFVEMRGPKGAFKFTANMAEHVGMIAGGTGITPILSVIHAMLDDPEDRTKMTLLFANLTSEDVLLEKELHDLQKLHSDRLTVHYTVDEPDEKWDGLVGRVNAGMLREVKMPTAADNGMIFMCGPPPMMTAMVKELEVLGYNVPPSQEGSRIFKF